MSPECLESQGSDVILDPSVPNGSVRNALALPPLGVLPPCPPIPPQAKSRVFAIVLFAEFLKELAAIAQEHSIAPDCCYAEEWWGRPAVNICLRRYWWWVIEGAAEDRTSPKNTKHKTCKWYYSLRSNTTCVRSNICGYLYSTVCLYSEQHLNILMFLPRVNTDDIYMLMKMIWKRLFWR